MNGKIAQNPVEEESNLLPEGNFKDSFMVENHVMEEQLVNEIAIPASVQVYNCFEYEQ